MKEGAPRPNNQEGNRDVPRRDKTSFTEKFERAWQEDESLRRGAFWIGVGGTAMAIGAVTGEQDIAYTGVVVTLLAGRELVDGLLSMRKK